MRIPIRFEPWYRVLSTLVGLPPSGAYLEIGPQEVYVRMGWAFRARFPRAAVASAEKYEGWTISRGVHGFAGRWLVNGSGSGLVRLRLEPVQRARMMGIPISLRELMVSVPAPDALIASLRC